MYVYANISSVPAHMYIHTTTCKIGKFTMTLKLCWKLKSADGNLEYRNICFIETPNTLYQFLSKEEGIYHLLKQNM